MIEITDTCLSEASSKILVMKRGDLILSMCKDGKITLGAAYTAKTATEELLKSSPHDGAFSDIFEKLKEMDETI